MVDRERVETRNDHLAYSRSAGGGSLPLHLARFFGVDEVDEVSLLIRLMPRDDRTGLPPECARGRTRVTQLPRWVNPTRINERHVFSINSISHTTLAERVVWIVERCSGPWSACDRGLLFESDEDAANYRLRWSEPPR